MDQPLCGIVLPSERFSHTFHCEPGVLEQRQDLCKRQDFAIAIVVGQCVLT